MNATRLRDLCPRRITPRTVGAAAAALVASACAAAGPSAPRAAAAPPAVAACDVERDRAAILAMAGSFDVDFAFQESESTRPEAALAEPYEAKARERVAVVEQSERRIVLQHVLLVKEEGEPEPSAMKHWRQDWVFEDRELLEFRGDRRWERRVLGDADARCTWSQAVFQVDDGPRYESSGRWVHEPERSTWTSAETWRPLPRREAERAGEYDVLVGVNRHVVTPQGWDHEQDNRKLVLSDARSVARERGLNRYVRSDFGADARIVRAYLDEIGPFWADVRVAWEQRLRDRDRIVVLDEVDGKTLYQTLFPLARSETARDPEKRREAIAIALDPFLSGSAPVRAASGSD
jgi:hypothetical protein